MREVGKRPQVNSAQNHGSLVAILILCTTWDMGVSKNQGPQYRPQILGLLL